MYLGSSKTRKSVYRTNRCLDRGELSLGSIIETKSETLSGYLLPLNFSSPS